MGFSLPHSQFSEHLMQLLIQLRENMTAIIVGMDERVTGRVETVSRYLATGSSTARVTLPRRAGKKTYAVLLVRGYPEHDPGADFSVTGQTNFTLGPTSISVPEPAGLVAGAVYTLTYLILE